jgi:hypothetical protein
MQRRSLLGLIGSVALAPARLHATVAVPRGTGAGALASAPIEVHGDWARSLPHAAWVVLVRMREVSLDGLNLLSDRQPERLRVDNHLTGPPHIWLHYDADPVAVIGVDIGQQDWCKLAYQFGHELGHVLCNSWRRDAAPRNPCQWLEEALAEAFSIRGLGRLAQSWAEASPFLGDAAFAGEIVRYRDNLVGKYRELAAAQGASTGLARWFRTYRPSLESEGGVTGVAGAAVPTVLAELEGQSDGVEGLEAMNRWPERTGLPIEDYLRRWKRSCAELGASQRLPIRLRTLLLG